MTETAVALRSLVRTFGDVRAVDDISLDVAGGEVFGLLGPNGAGKTTAIRIVTTLLPPTSGEAHVFGFDCRREAMTVRRSIGYVPQQLSADFGLTGYENVWLFARLFDIPRADLRDRVHASLEAMGLGDVSDRLASTYSGGMVRRLELAQALINQPRLLILDEPTIGLDPVGRAAVWEHVSELRRRTGMAVLLTTHYMEEADTLCDRIALMHRGKIRALGTTAELKQSLGATTTLDEVFRHFTGDTLEGAATPRDIRSTRRTARRLR